MVVRAGSLLSLVVASLTLSACGAKTPAVVALPDGSGTGLALEVTHVVDGDTVDLRLPDGSSGRARLLGIDTPETVKPNTPVQCFGPEASARTKALLPPGTEVLVQRDTEARDRYGRLLVYLWRRSDGLFVNGALVSDGFARTLFIEPNHAHRSDISAAASPARVAGRGLWGSCDPVPAGRPGR
jgi:micrococcal nuclease